MIMKSHKYKYLREKKGEIHEGIYSNHVNEITVLLVIDHSLRLYCYEPITNKHTYN